MNWTAERSGKCSQAKRIWDSWVTAVCSLSWSRTWAQTWCYSSQTPPTPGAIKASNTGTWITSAFSPDPVSRQANTWILARRGIVQTWFMNLGPPSCKTRLWGKQMQPGRSSSAKLKKGFLSFLIIKIACSYCKRLDENVENLVREKIKITHNPLS